MKQYVLQNILKKREIYSARCPKDEAICSLEYPDDKGNVIFRILKRWRQNVLQSTLNIRAVCSQHYPENTAS